jgi:hypothetical protein
LSLLVPSFVRDYLFNKNDTKYKMTQVYEEINIIFCDIVGFDEIIKVEEENIIEILD